MSDSDTTGDQLRLPFIFVRHGDPDPVEWKARHPGWVSIPAVMVPKDLGIRSYPQALDYLEQRRAAAAALAQARVAAIEATEHPTLGRSVAMGAPPMLRRPGRMMRGGSPPRYPGGFGAPKGQMPFVLNPVASYLRMNEAMTHVMAGFAEPQRQAAAEPA